MVHNLLDPSYLNGSVRRLERSFPEVQKTGCIAWRERSVRQQRVGFDFAATCQQRVYPRRGARQTRLPFVRGPLAVGKRQAARQDLSLRSLDSRPLRAKVRIGDYTTGGRWLYFGKRVTGAMAKNKRITVVPIHSSDLFRGSQKPDVISPLDILPEGAYA